jgi:hypothetical protein
MVAHSSKNNALEKWTHFPLFCGLRQLKALEFLLRMILLQGKKS